MELQSDVAGSSGQPRLRVRRSMGGLAGYVGIWAFLAIFLIYPLIRLFYDAFTTYEEAFTFMNFCDFFTDSFYLR
ncbi:MAG TPA: ABC transporter permease, partial [Syntrophobacteraceae bacterium]|nr:ABC transporter permease [Syntrophobacteraceae bacterium]